ncbi:MAG: RNA polymerase sigma factor [Steroidobacteraceae bacterium]
MRVVTPMVGENSREAKQRQSPIEAAFVKYERAIRRVVGRITRCRDEIDDVTQEAFLKAMIAERQRPIDNAKAYLFEAARNTALTQRSKKIRRILEAIEDCATVDMAQNEPSVESMESIMISRERLAMFCEAVAALPPQCRKVLLMAKIDGKSHREISETLGISESTIEKHIGTGLARCAAYIRSCEQGDARAAHVAPIAVGRRT